jgi:hypothetical protein
MSDQAPPSQRLQFASLCYRSYDRNSLFRPGAGEGNGEFYLPYGLLRERFLQTGVELNTPDVNRGRPVLFEFHVNARRKRPRSRAYVYLYENPLIRPLNRNLRILDRYARWFGWDRAVLDDSRGVELFYPNRICAGPWPGTEQRAIFLVLVASNKALLVHDARDQYRERVRFLRWYEAHAPEAFHLYGRGWDRPATQPGRWGRLVSQGRKFIRRFARFNSPFRTYRGPLARGPLAGKIELLARARFCLAYENCCDLGGYVTEKIFDCFQAGCVPVYIGPNDIDKLIPETCFIDGRRFTDPAALHDHLSSINDAAYRDYQNQIRSFCLSEQVKPFTREHFVETIVTDVMSDLKAAGLWSGTAQSALPVAGDASS